MDHIDRRTIIAGASLVGAAALARVAKAGDLNPPQGPITPTGRSLKEVEPRTPVNTLSGNPDYVCVITQPGSYYLTGDIVVPPGKRGILIAATTGGVSIDMSGFAIRGSQGSLGGILCATPGPDYVEIFDGYIRDMDGDGIDGGGCRILEIEDLHIDHCATAAIVYLSGIIRCCAFTRCTLDGARWNKLASQQATMCVFEDCDCRACGRYGLSVLGDWSSGDGTLCIADCDCIGNGQDGIHLTLVSQTQGGASLAASVQDCRCASNGGFGHRASTASLGGTRGVRCSMQMDSVVCSDNTLGGVRLFAMHADLMDCDCCDNGGDGFMLDTIDGSADGLTASRNTGAGVHLQGATRCSVCDCAMHSNAAEGLHADLACSGLSITECDAQGNAVGFRVESPSNLLLWNTAGANGANYDVSVPMPVVIIDPSQLATNTNPHANYSL